MKTKQQLEKEIERLQKQLKELKNQDFQSFKLGNKEIRVYKWENKKFKDFPMPKGFDWCRYFDFVKLINDEKIKLEKYPVFYYTKNQFKKNLTEGWMLSWVCFNRNGYVGSNDGGLRDSNGNGRVVVSK